MRDDAFWRRALYAPTCVGRDTTLFTIPIIFGGADPFVLKEEKGAAADFVPVGKNRKSLKVATWNARALFFHDHSIKTQKMKIANGHG